MLDGIRFYSKTECYGYCPMATLEASLSDHHGDDGDDPIPSHGEAYRYIDLIWRKSEFHGRGGSLTTSSFRIRLESWNSVRSVIFINCRVFFGHVKGKISFAGRCCWRSPLTFFSLLLFYFSKVYSKLILFSFLGLFYSWSADT